MFLVFAYLAILILKPFLLAVLTAVVITYIFYPLYNKLLKAIKREALSSFLVLLIILLIMVLPMAFIVNTLSREAVTAYSFVTGIVDKDIFEEECNTEKLVCKGINYIKDISSNQKFKEHFRSVFKGVVNFVVDKSSSFLFSIPKKMLEIFLVFFMMFFFFKDGKRIMERLWELITISEKDKKRIKKKISDVSFAVVYGSIFVALIQGLVAGIGYWIFGIKAPIFWGLITAVAALLPFIGTTLVWLPASLFLLLNGLVMSEPSGILKGIGLFVYCALIVSTLDNVLKPKIIGAKGKIHPVVVLLGVFGGLAVFGLVGGVVGPLVLALLVTFINMYASSLKEA